MKRYSLRRTTVGLALVATGLVAGGTLASTGIASAANAATSTVGTAAASIVDPTVERVETDSDGVYEAHVRLAAGSQVIVQVGKAFTVTGVQTMGTAPSGVAGPSSTTG